MKWVLIAVAVIVALVVLVAIIGALMPRGHVASSMARFRRPPEAVWAVITDFAAAPSWRPELKGVERGPDRNGHPVWVETSNHGRMPMEVEVFEPPRRMVTRIADDKLPFGGSWTFEVTPDADGCTLCITEDGEIYNVIFRFLSRTVFSHHATMDNYLRNLGKKLEEAVTPTHS